MSNASIEVVGLKEFAKSVKQIDRELPKAIRMTLNESVDLIAKPARADVPRGKGKAAKSVRTASTSNKARIRAGGKRAPYYPWLDFGGKVGRNRSVSRTYKKGGRYIYPNYRRLRDSGKFQDSMQEGLQSVGRRAGLVISND